MISKYRMYIDEVGNSDLNASDNPNHRYLSLTGVIAELEHIKDFVAPKIEDLKRKYFGSHPDEPVIFHKKELVNKKYPFHVLRNPEVEKNFNAELLGFLEEAEYLILTVVIDKLEFKQRYMVWLLDPYHYCLEVLVERFVLYLRERRVTGDVMAESRGGNDDMRLKKAFHNLYEQGIEQVSQDVFGQYLSSNQLKVKPKINNIAGLQIADLIAHPSYKAILASQNGHQLPANFGGEIIKILYKSKYRRSQTGKIEGWGTKWLP